jgi:hypothetical protein
MQQYIYITLLSLTSISSNGIIFSFTATTKNKKIHAKSSLTKTSSVINMVIMIWSSLCIFLRNVLILHLMKLQKMIWLLFFIKI